MTAASLALMFPGQGSQSVGMGQSLAAMFPEARRVFDEVDDALNESLSSVMWDGPEDALKLTANAQPALMAVSLAALRALEASGFDLETKAAYVAGHSLGEYSALAAVGSLTIPEAARLLRQRGAAMQAAVPVGEGAMAAILGLDIDTVEAIAHEATSMAVKSGTDTAVCEIANDNAPGQAVLSGNTDTINTAISLAKERGARRAVLLPVSAPFHCALIAPAAETMAEALSSIEIRAPRVPLVANVLARPIVEPAEIRVRLVEQVTGRVRWRESMQWLNAKGVTTFLEIGAGKVLTGLLKRIVDGARTLPVGTSDDVAEFARRLATFEQAPHNVDI